MSMENYRAAIDKLRDWVRERTPSHQRRRLTGEDIGTPDETTTACVYVLHRHGQTLLRVRFRRESLEHHGIDLVVAGIIELQHEAEHAILSANTIDAAEFASRYNQPDWSQN